MDTATKGREFGNLGMQLNVGDSFRIARNSHNHIKSEHAGAWMTIVEIKGYRGDTLMSIPRYIAKWDYERNQGFKITHKHFTAMYWLDRDWDICNKALPTVVSQRKELPNV